MQFKKVSRLKVFISYSSKDKKYLDKLLTHLRYLEKNYQIKVWNADELKPGTDWEQRIIKELNLAKIAILLISKDFLISDYILKVELPIILKAAKEKGTQVIPIIVNHCMFDDFRNLSCFESVNSPDSPLHDMNDSQIDKLFKELTKELKNYIFKHPKSEHKISGQQPNRLFEYEYTITQLSIVYTLQKNCVEQKGFTTTNIQELLKTTDRKSLVNSLNILNQNDLVIKLKHEGKTLYSITELGRKLCRELETIFTNGK